MTEPAVLATTDLADADVARRQRLIAAMSTPIAGWVSERVERLLHSCGASTAGPRYRVAQQLSDTWAHALLRLIYGHGMDPQAPQLRLEAAQTAAFMAWSRLHDVHANRPGEVVPQHLHFDIEALLEADAAARDARAELGGL